MSISFQLNLTPNQIEFLQQLDLYADGLVPISIPFDLSHQFSMIWLKKLEREGLVEHVILGEGERYDGGRGNGRVILAYRITEKGRAVLGLIEKDVNAFLSRQRDYQQKKNSRKRA